VKPYWRNSYSILILSYWFTGSILDSYSSIVLDSIWFFKIVQKLLEEEMLVQLSNRYCLFTQNPVRFICSVVLDPDDPPREKKAAINSTGWGIILFIANVREGG
jgi:hypothetical protein